LGIVLLDMAMSLDGFITGPEGEDAGLHDWFFPPAGGRNAADTGVVEESIGSAGAILMGRRTYDLGEEVAGFADTPYRVPHFVLSHGAPAEVDEGSLPFTFVSDGLESAIEQARAVAGEGNVVIGGGADVARQGMEAGLVDEIAIHLVPVLLGGGVRLFERLDTGRIGLERTETIESPFATHLRFRVVGRPEEV
jgi:dihydrofolate reductase